MQIEFLTNEELLIELLKRESISGVFVSTENTGDDARLCFSDHLNKSQAEYLLALGLSYVQRLDDDDDNEKNWY